MPKDYGSFCRFNRNCFVNYMTFCTSTNWTEVDAFYMSSISQMVSVGLKWFLVSGFPCNNKQARKVSGLGDVHKATNSLLSFFGILLLTVMFRHICCFYLVQAGVSPFVAKISFISTTHFYITVSKLFFLLQSVSSFRFLHNIIFKLI